jgi:hypothetical protein
VDWASATRHVGDTHTHTWTQAGFDGYYALGLRAFSLTNYFPSEPTCPLDAFFIDPGGTICIPASEVHSMTGGTSPFFTDTTHFVALGSMLDTGDGADAPWQDVAEDILEQLAWPDGGGIVIAHPLWSFLDAEAIGEFLDFDPRVLGIEAFNYFVQTNPDYAPDRRASAIPLWDEILTAGRRCLGFFVTDHKHTPGSQGFSVLLLPAFTAEAAARAYRRGEFYGALHGTGLVLEQLTPVRSPEGQRGVRVITDSADELRLICNGAVVDTIAGATGTLTVPDDAVYGRVEAENELDTIYSQPIYY